MNSRNSIVGLTIALILTCIIFVAFRYFLTDNPNVSRYAGEIAAAFLGGLITVAITGVLLHKQSEVELNKERNVRILDAKIQTYNEVFQSLEIIVKDGEVKDDEKIKMQLLYQKLIQIAPFSVLEKFQTFLIEYKKAVKNNNIDEDEMQVLLERLLHVNMEIRIDIASIEERPQIIREQGKIVEIAHQSLKLLDPRATKEDFLDNCDEIEKIYYSKVLEFVEKSSNKLQAKFGTTGFSVNGVVLCYPTQSRKNIELISTKLSDEMKTLIGGDKSIDFAKQRIPLSSKTLPIETMQRILNLIK